ncbi:uncharacterized protein LOC134851171 isoform X2 [Symsagittifera roscoffensis]|uniref:uncharacterized protein LOC134851171 isoform X2 n=1 Tax=Symsagittifera roscoffensis TaxID=84072 RepID=UPI00307C09DB
MHCTQRTRLPLENAGMVKMCYRFNYAGESLIGFIIEKKGNGIKRLLEIDGVRKVRVDTSAVPNYFEIHVIGVNKSACDQVCTEVEKKLADFRAQDSLTAFDCATPTFDAIKLRKFQRESTEPVVIGKQQNESEEERDIFTVSKFVRRDHNSQEPQQTTFNDIRVQDNYFDFSEEKLESFFNNALSNLNQSANPKLSFRIRLGKSVFWRINKNQTDENLVKKKLVANKFYLEKEHGLSQGFVPSLNPEYFQQEYIIKQFEKLGFEDVSELYAKQDMFVSFSRTGDTWSSMRVVLAKDPQPDSAKKEELISAILSAEAIGQSVLDKVDKKDLKMTYFKTKKLLKLGDKTSKQTSDALRILYDAYCRLASLKTENSAHDSPHNSGQNLIEAFEQIGFCKITALREAPLDWRASLLLEAKHYLPEGLQVLSECWDQCSSTEDSYYDFSKEFSVGELESELEERLKVNCIKRILETSYWVNEIRSDDKDEDCRELIRVKVIWGKLSRGDYL